MSNVAGSIPFKIGLDQLKTIIVDALNKDGSFGPLTAEDVSIDHDVVDTSEDGAGWAAYRFQFNGLKVTVKRKYSLPKFAS